MNFQAGRDGKTVQIKVKYHDDVNWWLFFSHTFENEVVAETMLQALRHNVEELVRSKVQKAYELGWKDAKSKNRAKRTRFGSCINYTGDMPAW